MSENKAIKTCGECRYHKGMRCHLPNKTIIILPETEACRHFIPKPKLTVFDYITQNVDTLAEKLVYEAITCDGDGHVLSGYRSILTNGFWINKPEAIAATVEELQKEWKG